MRYAPTIVSYTDLNMISKNLKALVILLILLPTLSSCDNTKNEDNQLTREEKLKRPTPLYEETDEVNRIRDQVMRNIPEE